MPWIFLSYWWLIFPIGAIAFGAWDRWLAYKRSQNHLDLIREFAAQGKDPPPELMRSFREEPTPDEMDDYWMHPRYRRMRRSYRRYARWSPYGQWRGAIITGALAAGFWWASEYADIPQADGAFRIVAVIMTCVAAANLLGAIVSTSFRDR